MQTLALPAVLHPGVAAAVGQQAVLVQALAAQPWVALRAAEQVQSWVLTVTHHPPAHHHTALARTHGTPVIFQHPDLAVVFDFVFMDTIASTVMTMWTSAVVSPVQIKADCIVGTRVSF